MKPKYLKNVVTLELNLARCTGCGMCTNVCPHTVFALQGKKATIAARDNCMECGACARNCPADAIQVRAGVGCAYAIIAGTLAGIAPSCGCSKEKGSCCGS